jgi:hypothetical protein
MRLRDRINGGELDSRLISSYTCTFKTIDKWTTYSTQMNKDSGLISMHHFYYPGEQGNRSGRFIEKEKG